MCDPLTLSAAQKCIRAQVHRFSRDRLPLLEALGRITAKTVDSLHSLPSYSQSIYDGYVLTKEGLREIDGQIVCEVKGEIQAGDISPRESPPGTCYRIMTGAPVPKGSWKVIPQENCKVEDNRVFITPQVVANSSENIRRVGSEIKRGARLLESGVCLTPCHLSILAEAGHEEIDVYCRPKVSFFCTGSELVNRKAALKKGLKISSNRYLLSGLIRTHGGIGQDWGTVSDTPSDLSEHLDKIVRSDTDVIVSTGGMGPGKYDLVEEAFRKNGGEVLFSSIMLRPGKSVLFGTIGARLYFGLPGPPFGVSALFHVLVMQLLLQLQGVKRGGSTKTSALLSENVNTKRTGMPRIISGIFADGKNGKVVRPLMRREIPNCYIMVHADRQKLKMNERVTIYPSSPSIPLSCGYTESFWQHRQK